MNYSLPPTIPAPQADPFAPKPDPRPRQVRWAKRIAILFGAPIVAFLALVVLVAIFGSPTPAPVVVPAPAPSAVAAPPAAPMITLPAPAAPTAPANAFGQGIYDVGHGSGQLAPGKYRTAGPGAGEHYCYYARLKDTDAQIDSIIANVNTRGPAVVTVKPTDAAFEIQGDCVFERVS